MRSLALYKNRDVLRSYELRYPANTLMQRRPICSDLERIQYV